MSKQALGRGFDSLIPTNFTVDDVASPGEHVKNIEIDKIVANPDQPRKDFDQDSLLELAESIKQHGVIQPLVVTPYGELFRIVAGERRYRASKLAGLRKIPVIVRNHEELEELEIALVENVQRVDLSPVEQALSISKLHEQFSMSYKEIAKKLGKAETTVSNIVRLLQLPEPALIALKENKITEGHARAILSLKTDPELQIQLLNTIITQGISVRQAEAFAQNSKSIHRPKRIDNKISPDVQLLLNRLDKNLAHKLSVKERSNSTGIISIQYSNNDELKSILDRLSKAS